MNVSLQNIDKVSALLTVKLEKADYQPQVDKSLKNIRQKAQVPGFRPGMVPMSLVKKMYGKSVIADEVNKLLSEKVYEYIKENNVNILGEPMPNEEKQPDIDFDTMEEFEFVFDIALAPEFKAEVSSQDKVDYYTIEVTDEMVENQIKAYTQRNGKYEQVEAYEENDMLKGLLAELDEEGNTKEGGIQVEGAVMMPAIGFGVFQIPENETERAVNDAIEIGYRKFDTAAAYFNEEQLGNAIRQSGIKREEFFITTKLWVQDYEYDDALRAFDLSMKKLGLDYLDLYLMHKPYGNYYAAWRAMERLYKEGRIRAIGVTSFSNERLQDLFLHNEIKPVVNQLETHPFFQQQAVNAFLQQEGIQHEAWAPFAEGQNDIFNHPTLKAIAEQHDKGVGAVILRWLNQRNIVVIPKSVHKERMIENFNILDFTLSKEEMDAIALLETGKSPIYDDMDLLTVKGIGLHKIHE